MSPKKPRERNFFVAVARTVVGRGRRRPSRLRLRLRLRLRPFLLLFHDMIPNAVPTGWTGCIMAILRQPFVETCTAELMLASGAVARAPLHQGCGADAAVHRAVLQVSFQHPIGVDMVVEPFPRKFTVGAIYGASPPPWLPSNRRRHGGGCDSRCRHGGGSRSHRPCKVDARVTYSCNRVQFHSQTTHLLPAIIYQSRKDVVVIDHIARGDGFGPQILETLDVTADTR